MSLGIYSLGPESRLRTRKEFDRVFSLGRKAAGRNLILWHGRALCGDGALLAPGVSGGQEPPSPKARAVLLSPEGAGAGVALPLSTGGARLGLAISARVGCAVKRNRFKRLAREAFRLNRPKLRQGTDMVVYIRPGCRWRGLAGAQEDFLQLCAKEGLLTA